MKMFIEMHCVEVKMEVKTSSKVFVFFSGLVC